ncbi:ABC transporter substrate-binding protein [Oscillospiraceae bacterium CLA-AA-H272]|jgi:peptide/nickel transport system substrate-binding protein|uniref:ABC transporter substrate-binding protein n=1 Tax=Brotocaccenecus cirricatena TaxID=3064195 RepID=A0AAE3DEJ6_9FIRM|nr:ABC transporter substrate-binding protein [Brotocaccenecus cirricatena]MCC2129605.1 ABC transporter substrate-binding protein [Brotocaccenecus cirricatena]
MKKKLLALFLALVMVGAVLPGCGDGSKDPGGQGNNGKTGEPVKGGEITVGIAQDLDDSLDPHQTVAAGTREVLFNIFEGLVKPNSDGEMIPAVAEKYTLSEDGTTYTFTLREGVKFHNGQTVTAEDVVYSINRCAAVPEGQEKPLVAAFSAVKSVEALDEKTVAVTIAQRDLEFISYMTAAIIPADYENQDTAPVGTGPFKFVSRTPQQDFVMERFEDYWGAPAWLDKVTYKICENADALVMNLNGGSIDLCAHLTSAQASQLNQNFQVLEGTMNLVQAIYLNNQAKPFDNQLVRQALCYAIDRQGIMDMVADGHGTAVGSSIYPAFTKYFLPELVDKYPHDVAKAKELLAQAGYPDGFDMTISVPNNYQPHMDTAEVVAEQLREAGINVTIQPVEWSTWLDTIYNGRQFQATVVGVDAANMTARAMLERFTSDYGKNFINYNNPAYDTLFQQAINAQDEATQTDLYKQMESMLADTAANVYIQDLCDLVAMRQDLGGLKFYPIYVLDLSTVYLTQR